MFLLFIYNPFDFLIWYLSPLCHLMMHSTYSQQVVIIQAFIVIGLNRYGMMDGKIMIVVLLIGIVQVADTYLA